MQVTIRKRPMTKGRQSLYLDFYPAIPHPETLKPTRREYLGLYIWDKPTNAIDKAHNKETLALAKNIQAKRQLSLQADDYGFLKADNGGTDFLAYFKGLADKHKEKGGGDKNNWQSVYNYLSIFTDGQCQVKDITEHFCKEFKEYILNASPLVETKDKLANNSAVGYFNIFKRAIKDAHNNKMLSEDFAFNVPAIKKTETKREFLTLDELQLLAKTDCDLPTVKNAALFSALTGLRYSDVEKLTWQDIQGTDRDGYFIRFTQKKTKGVETMPISHDAYNLLGERKEAEEKTFPNMLYSAWQNQKIQDWVYKAGIYRKITFHSFRHTFATLQLTLGTDLYTISKLLGHKSINTTQIYAKIIDQTKREAVNKIKINLSS